MCLESRNVANIYIQRRVVKGKKFDIFYAKKAINNLAIKKVCCRPCDLVEQCLMIMK